ncbi:MAG: hypothetical protein ACYSUV_01985 [Planctomycetota bacterium]|jgi:hypothetical protein
MAFLTETTLAKTLDIPISLPATEVRQGDWLVVATINVVSPMKLVYQYLTLQMLSSSVSTNLIATENKVSPALDLAFIGLYRNYLSGYPGTQPALDIVKIRESATTETDCIPVNQLSGQFITVRTSPVIEYTTPGVYSFIIANNMQASSSSSVPVTTSIDFRLSVTGMIRMKLEGG